MDKADLQQAILDVLRAWGRGKVALAPKIRERIERARDVLRDGELELPADDVELIQGIWKRLS